MALAQVEKTPPAPVTMGEAPKPPAQPAPAGGVHFVSAARHKVLCAELRERRYLIAPVAAPERGRLRNAIDDAVEGALAMRGALPPGAPPEAALESTLRDQVFRARALGAAGLAVTLPQLGDVLDAADGAALSAWLATARRAPLLVVLDERDRAARVLTPVAIGDLAGPSPLSTTDGAPLPRELEDGGAALAETPSVPPPPVLSMPRRGVMRKPLLRVAVAPEPVPEPSPPARSHGRGSAELAEPLPTTPAAAPEPPCPDSSEIVVAAPPPAPEPHLDLPAPAAPPPPPVAEASPEELAPPPVATRDGAARRAVDTAEWQRHAFDLDKARGPKPVSVIERLFAARYMPLLGASLRGEVDGAVRGVVDAWRVSFEHSYREAFAALRVTGKRPPMVFDAPDLAARLARLNGARAVKLVLVDAMRFDLGERVADRLKEQLAGRAVCVERMLLWAALPTTTQVQLGLLARGPEALRDAEPASEPESEIVRGRAVGTVRRDRVGSREIMKLDLVEARLRNTGAPYEERLESLADEVAPILVKYVETLPPRTLVFLFGDHGFRLSASPDGRATGPATQGGVSPEEVLVPAQAWLLGGVH